MKVLKAAVAAIVMTCSAMAAGSALAVEFRNYDSQNLKVKITSPSMKKDVEFRAMSRSLVICIDKCKFEIAGVGTVTATRDDIVTVEAGKVTATRVASR